MRSLFTSICRYATLKGAPEKRCLDYLEEAIDNAQATHCDDAFRKQRVPDGRRLQRESHRV